MKLRQMLKHWWLNTDHTDIFNAPNTDVIDATNVIIHWKSIFVQNMEIGYSLSYIFLMEYSPILKA